MHLLGDISDATYEDAKKDVDALNKKIAEIQKQISLIDSYKIEDMDAELAKIEKVKAEFNAERQNEVRKIQYELQSAKLDYLRAMDKARTDYKKVC